MKTLRIGALAALLLLTVAVGGVLQPGGAHGAAADQNRSIVVSGVGAIATVPDRGSFVFGVATPAKTASAAIQANTTAARAVVAALRGAGIAARDLQTSQITLDQRASDDGQTIVGYTATTSVEAQLRDLTRAGAVVDAAVGAGADSVSGPSLTRGDSTAIYREALRAAVDDAKAKAQALASASKLTLGEVTNVTEGGAAPVPMTLAAGKADSSVQIEPGTQLIQASVTVTFAAS